MAAAAQIAVRVAAEGLVDAYIHGNGRIGVLVEVNIEIDFAAANEEFKQLVRDIRYGGHCCQAPNMSAGEDVPAEVIEKEMNILKAQARNEGKPEKVIEKMVEGRIEKFYKEVCLTRTAPSRLRIRIRQSNSSSPRRSQR